MTTLCPCGSKQSYDLCCARFITGKEIPKTAEALMRSRYSAYSLGDVDYIANTMKGRAANGFDLEKARQAKSQVKWLSLEVIASQSQGQSATVEFRAIYFYEHKKHILHERSLFQFENERWYYVDGESLDRFSPSIKISRNDPCPCGSQKKYKKCCLM